MDHAQIIKLGKDEYVIIPKAEYLRLQQLAGVPDGSVDALEFARSAIGRTLKAAREVASLTQSELAEKLGKSQPLVSGAESGTISVSERYVASVLKACRLPSDWKPTTPRGRSKKAERSGHTITK
jgi:ribosome-binding protein aMBF1 (putative translation factor)